MPEISAVKKWQNRIQSAKDHKKTSDKKNRVDDCYNYWRGDQLVNELDANSQRKVQINKIHPEVKNSLPSLYFYAPFARISAEPEEVDDPGTTVEDQAQLLQDTVNHLIRDPDTMFQESTLLALKEAHWNMGVIEVGYSAEFVDAPTKPRPELKEKKDTKADPKPEDPLDSTSSSAPFEPAPMDPMIDPMDQMSAESMDPTMAAPLPEDELAMQAEIERLKAEIESEHFFVKHIPSNQVLISRSDKPILTLNDWVGYWEDLPLEDVKKTKAYKVPKDLKATTNDPEREKEKLSDETSDQSGDTIRIYKIWDLRSRNKLVLAEGHDEFLMVKSYKRCPLKFLRFDVDPYHFYPRPPILSKLAPQDEYNDSREYLRKVRKGTVPRYTYDQEAIDAVEMSKLESGEIGIYIPRKGNTSGVIEPVQQPSFSDNAMTTLTLADKEVRDVGGIGGDAQVAASKTATQAKIAEAKTQAQDSFERTQVAQWLAEISQELLQISIEEMRLDKWVKINVPADTQYAQQLGADIADKFQKINAQKLSDTASGIRWRVIVDIENLSPVSEQEKLDKWMKALELILNPNASQLFAVAPPILQHTLKLMGMRSAKEQGLVAEGVQALAQIQQQMAMMGQQSAKGQPSQPAPKQDQPGGPQPAAPAGPGTPQA